MNAAARLMGLLPVALLRRAMPPVRRARTTAEREAIYRFRYSVYVEELGRSIGGVDHAARMVRDESDEAPSATHLYVGDVDDLQGVIRVRVWPAGGVPPKDVHALSLDRFDGYFDARPISELGRLMVRQDQRRTAVLPAMVQRCFDFLAHEARVRFAFCTCRPGLVEVYRQLGFRPYGGALVEAPEGLEVPLLMVPDHGHFAKVGSPLAGMVKASFGRRFLEDETFSPIMARLEDEPPNIRTSPERVWEEFARELRFQQATGGDSFLDRLPESTAKVLAQGGCVVDTPAGTVVTRAGHAERELFIVLAGRFAAERGGETVEVMGRGQVFGEVAFFRDAGVRVATVRALSDGRVIILRRSFLKRLLEDDPHGAQAVLFELARTLSERLASM